MKRNQSSRNDTGKTDWQLIGDFKLPIGREPDAVVTTWLVDLLTPLDLHPDFFNKVLKSALEAARRTMQPGPTIKFEHIHLLLFAPIDLKSNGKTWGFFRIEKIEGAADAIFPNHAIEFYRFLGV